MKVACIIPARLDSTRLPEKPLRIAWHQPLVAWTVDNLTRDTLVRDFDHVEVVTDSAEVCRALRGVCRSTLQQGEFRNGTERIAEWVNRSEVWPDLIVNCQVDEPEIDRYYFLEMIESAIRFPACDIATLATSLTVDEQQDRNVVKVRRGAGGFATAFSRDPLAGCAYRHIGVYAYTPAFLRWYAEQKPTQGEESESLEQLRALERGCRIRVGVVDHPYRSIDTEEDLREFAERVRARSADGAAVS